MNVCIAFGAIHSDLFITHAYVFMNSLHLQMTAVWLLERAVNAIVKTKNQKIHNEIFRFGLGRSEKTV